MKVDGSLKSLLQGVSQQPPRDRLPGQCTLQENMSSDPITGLTRRPGTDLVNLLVTSANIRGWYEFDVKNGRKFLAVFFINDAGAGDVRVFDLNGTYIPTTVDENARPYIVQPGDLRFNTMENDTYVVNRGKATRMAEGFFNYYNREDKFAAIVQVLGGQYGRKYVINIDGLDYAWFDTPDGSKATLDENEAIDGERSASRIIATSFIARQLVKSLEASSLKNAGWWWHRKDDIIVLYKPGSHRDQHNVTVNDGFGNTNIKAMAGTIPRKEDLPRYAPHNYVVRVAERTDPEMDIWLRYIRTGYEANENSDDNQLYDGYWQETIAPNTSRFIAADTMPHVLSYTEGNPGSFRFSLEDWKPRRVGTLTSNPNPSFLGDRINDVFTFQGRLGFLAGPNVIMSRTNRDTDFWFSSVSQQQDSDPIDVRSKVEASTMQAAVQHNRDLVIFSNKGQFIMFGRNQLTPANASLVLTSSFEAELRAKPVGAGRNVFFATNYGQYTGIREFFVESGTDINDARDVTQHVKKYINGRVTKMATSSNYDTLLVQTDDDDKTVYWYQYIWKDQEKVQSSWSKLIFNTDVVHTFFDEEVVYFVMKVENSYYLYRMSLDVQEELDYNYHLHLDDRFDVGTIKTNPDGTYEIQGVRTQFYLPYNYLNTDDLVFVQGLNCPTPGLPVPIANRELEDGKIKITLSKDMQNGLLVGGRGFRSVYVPTMPMVKDENGTKIGTGNFVINRFRVSLSRTGEVNGQAVSEYGDQEPIRFNGRIVGDVFNRVGEQPLSDEQFIVPFNSKADLGQIILWTDSHLPMTFLDIEWEGQYTKRGRRITTGE